MNKPLICMFSFGLLTLTAGCDLFSFKTLVPHVEPNTPPGPQGDDTDTTPTDTDTGDVTDTSPPDADGDGYDASVDCDDSNADINPDATEVCDADDVDEDCDGFADDADPEGADGATLFYVDGDGDGYGGVDAEEVLYCDAPDGGISLDNTDCVDDDADISPGEPEICDGVDQNCDEVADEGLADADKDGVCDDIDACSGDDATGDGDKDGFCDDVDTCVGDDLVGDTDLDGDCDDIDLDDDDDGTLDDDDCAPLDASYQLGTTWYADSDNDGYGDPDSPTDFCEDPKSGYSLDDTDCDDTDPDLNWDDLDGDFFASCDGDCDDTVSGGDVFPGAEEICDGVDNDCDDTIDFAWFSTDFEAGVAAAGITLNGDATEVSAFGDTSLELLDGVTGSQGSTAFIDALFPADEALHISFTVDISTSGPGNAGDGMTFALLESDDTCALGGAGGALGIQGEVGYFFELDIYDNGTDTDGDRGVIEGGEYPHCALMETGTEGGDFEELAYDDGVCSTGFLDAGEVLVEIAFDEGVYEMALDGVVVLSGTSSYDTLGDLMLGFSAGSGGAVAAATVDDIFIDCINTETTAVGTCACAEYDEDLGTTTGAAVSSGSTFGLGDDFSGSCGSVGIADTALLWTAPSAGCYTFDTDGSDFDTVLYLTDDCGTTESACDDDGLGIDNLSSLDKFFSAGESALIVIDGFDSPGNYVLNIDGC